MKPGILVINFGGPQSEKELVPFLTELLSDVLPLWSFLKPLLVPFIARRRAVVVAPKYAEIGWSPLVPQTGDLADTMALTMGEACPPIATAMMFSPPTMADGIASLRKQGVDKIIALGLFPHESFATSRAAYGFFSDALPAGMDSVTIDAFHSNEAYITALVRSIEIGVANTPGDDELHLLFSPHGLPQSFIDRGDPYPEHIEASVRLALERLGWKGPWHLGWQSRVGPVKWLEPSTTTEVLRLGSEGVNRVCVVPVSFICEGIETLHELDIELAEELHAAGIEHYGRAPALGADNADLVRCLIGLVTPHL